MLFGRRNVAPRADIMPNMGWRVSVYARGGGMTHQRHVDGVCVRCGFVWSPWCCGKTGAEAIIFTIVDVVLHSEWRRAVNIGVHPEDYRRMRDMCGWWRSCWPVV